MPYRRLETVITLVLMIKAVPYRQSPRLAGWHELGERLDCWVTETRKVDFSEARDCVPGRLRHFFTL
jgi:hypothetical protein